MKWAVTRLCRPTGYGDYLWAGRPMFSAVGLFLGSKSKILQLQNVIYFQSYIRLQNFRLLGSIIKMKSLSRSIPLSIRYRLFFETQGRKHGRNLSWSCMMIPVRQPMIIIIKAIHLTSSLVEINCRHDTVNNL